MAVIGWGSRRGGRRVVCCEFVVRHREDSVGSVRLEVERVSYHLIWLAGLIVATALLIWLLARGNCATCVHAIHPYWEKVGYKKFELRGELRCKHFGVLLDNKPCRWYRRQP